MTRFTSLWIKIAILPTLFIIAFLYLTWDYTGGESGAHPSDNIYIRARIVEIQQKYSKFQIIATTYSKDLKKLGVTNGILTLYNAPIDGHNRDDIVILRGSEWQSRFEVKKILNNYFQWYGVDRLTVIFVIFIFLSSATGIISVVRKT